MKKYIVYIWDNLIMAPTPAGVYEVEAKNVHDALEIINQIIKDNDQDPSTYRFSIAEKDD